MNSKIKNVIFKLFIGIAVGVSIGLNCFSLICHNGAGGGGGTGEEKLFLINPIETLATEGAGYFFGIPVES